MSISANDKRLNLISRGNLATIALEKFALEVELQKEALLNQAKGEFRAGRITHDAMVGLLAGHIALDNVMSALKSQVLSGNTAIKKETPNDD
jgi:hypothetical protein